jgi:hyperosmotically inducible protein
MNRVLLATSVIALGAVAAGCNRPNTGSTANNNSGASVATAPAANSTSTTSSTDPASPGATAAAPGGTPVAGAGPGNVVADTVTTGKVKTAIAADNAMKDADIMVNTSNGIVVLSGNAKSQDQVSLATRLAQRQEGVTAVESRVAVR